MSRKYCSYGSASPASQRGATTMVITLLLLVILTVVVLFSTNVAYFEQRTANNENRARLAEQVAEYALSMAVEYLKVNRKKVISNLATDEGWLAGTAGKPGWVACLGEGATLPDGTPHPCQSERDPDRRDELWFYTTDGAGDTEATTQLPFGAVTGTVGSVGGSVFASQASVQALLCRIDTSLATPACQANPAEGNRIAVTLVSEGSLTGESASASVKETWGTVSDFSPSAAVPLVGSGLVKGLGNAQIVANPNAGGFGVPASVWSPNDVAVGTSGAGTVCPPGGGIGSVNTCHLGEYLKNTAVADLQTACTADSTACGCPSVADAGGDLLSAGGAAKVEGVDILDIDKNGGALPDITFFPGRDCAGTQYDNSADETDDSLFEWIFNASNVVSEGGTTVNTDCGSAKTTNCAIHILKEELSAEEVKCAELTDAWGAAASGLYYVTDSGTQKCGLPAKVGSPDSPVILVMDNYAEIKNTAFHGMLFVRSDFPFDKTGKQAQFVGAAGNNSIVFGSVVVEGDIDIKGSINIVYVDTSVGNDPNKLPNTAKFARVPGSWLDAGQGF